MEFCLALNIVHLDQLLTTTWDALFSELGPYLSRSSMVCLLAVKTEITNVSTLCPQLIASSQTKFYHKWQSHCFDRVEGQECGHSSWGIQVFFWLFSG